VADQRVWPRRRRKSGGALFKGTLRYAVFVSWARASGKKRSRSKFSAYQGMLVTGVRLGFRSFDFAVWSGLQLVLEPTICHFPSGRPS
jgi:hypothetical protein